jgi:hypothetical protein
MDHKPIIQALTVYYIVKKDSPEQHSTRNILLCHPYIVLKSKDMEFEEQNVKYKLQNLPLFHLSCYFSQQAFPTSCLVTIHIYKFQKKTNLCPLK